MGAQAVDPPPHEWTSQNPLDSPASPLLALILRFVLVQTLIQHLHWTQHTSIRLLSTSPSAARPPRPPPSPISPFSPPEMPLFPSSPAPGSVPVFNSACPWASSAADLAGLWDCEETSAITTRTCTLNGFADDASKHQVCLRFLCIAAEGEGEEGGRRSVSGLTRRRENARRSLSSVPPPNPRPTASATVPTLSRNTSTGSVRFSRLRQHRRRRRSE